MIRSTNCKVFLLSFILLLLSQVGKAQGPPPPAAPTEENAVLVDEIIVLTNYEAYFKNQCVKRVTNHAKENNWTSEKMQKILKSINFKYFNFTIHNAFAFYTTEELKQIIELYKSLRKNKMHRELLLTNSMIEGNLALFAEEVIEGKYVE